VKVTVEKLDDINYIVRGNVENSVVQEKVAQLKAQANKEEKDASDKEKDVEQDAASEVFKDFIDAGIKEANIDIDTILGQPVLKRYEQLEDSIFFEVEIATSPEINVDIDISDIIPSFVRPTADPKAVEAKLAEFALKHAPFTKIPEARAIEDGDVAVIDFTGYIDGELFEGGSAEKFNIKVGSKSFIQGFEEQLIGMEYGEERTITINFPTDYQAADLAGKEAKFDIKLHEIQEQHPQTPDDAFAKKALSDPRATLASLKEKLAEDVTTAELSEIYITQLKPKIVAGLMEKFDFTLPNNVVEQEIDAKVREKTKGYSPEQHKVYTEDKGKFMELRESVREAARATIKKALIVEALAKKMGVEVDDHEVQAALGYQAMMTGQDAQELVKYYEENNLMTSAKLGLTEDKLFGQLLGFDKR